MMPAMSGIAVLSRVMLLLVVLVASGQEVALAGPAPSQAPRPQILERYTNAARLVVINKRTAQREELVLPTGRTTTVDDLEITLHRCWIEAAPALPQHAALVEIKKRGRYYDTSLIFAGWLFAYAPELSHLQHPKYDVSLLECVDQKKTPDEQQGAS